MATKINNRPGLPGGNVGWDSGLNVGEPLSPGRKTFTDGTETIVVSGSGRLEENSNNRGITVNFAQDVPFLEVTSDAITLKFNPPVRAVAAQFVAMSAHLPQAFTAFARARLADGSSSAKFSNKGTTTTTRDDSAVCLGVQCSAADADIASVSFTLTTVVDLSNPLFGFGINVVTYAGAAAAGLAPAEG